MIYQRATVTLIFLIFTLCMSVNSETITNVQYEPFPYETSDPAQLLSNPRLVKPYYNCFLGYRKCPRNELATRIKEILPEIVSTNCAKCSEDQKIFLARAVAYVKKNDPTIYNRFVKKYGTFGKKKYSNKNNRNEYYSYSK